MMTNDESSNFIHASAQIAGNEFLLEMPFYETTRQLFKAAGAASEKFITEGALRAHWSLIMEPGSPEYEELLELTNPLILRSGYHEFDDEMLHLPKEKYMQFLRDFGNRFIGIHGIHERMGGVAWAHTVENIIKEIKDKTGVAVNKPENRSECRQFMKTLYSAITQKDYYKVYSTHAAPNDHFLYKIGVSLCSAEIGAFMPCTSMQMSSIRGAARQYDSPWGVCLTAWTLNNGNADHTNYSFPSSSSKTSFSSGSGWSQGPLMGPSLSLQKRNLYMAYMSGATLISHESDCNYTMDPHLPDSKPESIFIAHYSEKGAESCSSRYLSPLGEIYKEFYDKIVKKHHRGVCYNPIGIILDEVHGYNAAYDTGHLLLSDIPYEKCDFSLRALINTIYPWEERQRGPGNNMENQIMVSSPYGDIFDFLTMEADAGLLKKYPVIIVAGNPEISKEGANKLKEFVGQGGTLIANTKQLNEYLGADYFGCRLDGIAGTGSYVVDTRTEELIPENGSYTFDHVQMTEGCPVYTTVQGNWSYPVITEVQRGNGKAILFTPHWMMPDDSTNRLLNCFGLLLQTFVKERVPAHVQGDLEYMFSHSRTGWIITVFNNNGVTKVPGMKETIDKEQDISAIIGWDQSSPLKDVVEINEWTQEKMYIADQSGSGWSIEVLIPAGGFRIIEFLIKL